MKPLLFTALALGLGAGQTLRTDYGRDRSLTVTVESSTETETTASEVTIDGEPVEGRGGFGGMGGGTSARRAYAYTDTVLATKDGAPTKVKRAFGDVGGSMTRPGRDGDMEVDLESAFADAVLVLDASGDETKIEVVEGKLEDDQTEGLVPTLLLDRLLPGGDVEAGGTWEPSGEDVLAALGTALERQLFRPRAREDAGDGPGQRGGGGGRGGFRGGMGGGGGLDLLAGGEWDTKATLTDETEEIDGVACAVIELEFEVSGELPEMGGGRRGRDRAFGPLEAPRANTFEAELEGKLFWSFAEARPVRLRLAGKIETVMDNERETERGQFRMHQERETRIDVRVDVTAGAKGE